ncbi:MAG: M23 family metallopeptidase [Bacteroidales bacterium]
MSTIFFKSALSILLLFLSLCMQGQSEYPAGYFVPPLDGRLLLSGTFGEIRAGHFHSGIDIKTGGVEGKPIYAVADGHVSRIKVSATGFGKALYIDHPNGYTSVYAHLSRYNHAIGGYVFREHYRKESFEIELFPAPGEYPVKKGEVVGYSGNSGTSGGPHLHFELRNTATQKPINPLLFGYAVKDFYRPRITSVKIYPEDENATVNGKNKPLRILVEGWGEEHRLAKGQNVILSGSISFAVQTYDLLNDADNKNGPYSITLFIDGEEVFHIEKISFAFDQTRYVNSYLDYEEYVRSNARMQRTRIDPGNRLGDLYGRVENKGIYCFNDTLMHDIRYEVRDMAGNVGALVFQVRSEVRSQKLEDRSQKTEDESGLSIFKYDEANVFKNDLVRVSAKAGAFYDSFEFRYDSSRSVAGTYGLVHHIHDKHTPVHEFIALAIRADGLPERYRDKTLVVKIRDDGKSFTSAGGQWNGDGFVGTRIREFGNYSVAVDTVPPKITPLRPESFKNLSAARQVRFRISDEISGIKSYRGTLNGKWILMEYDAKNNLLVYAFDENFLKGSNAFALEVIDMKDNKATYQAELVK